MADNNENKTKIETCRFSHQSIKKHQDGTPIVHCSRKTIDDNHWCETNESACEQCSLYKSRYMEFPLTINGIESKKLYYKGFLHQQGGLVKVRPCGEEYGKKTYLGFYLGDLPLAITHIFNEESGILKAFTHDNPAIFVPELGKIIWGCESWWDEIKNENEIKEITDDDISNVWYVKLAKQLMGQRDEQKVEPQETEQP